MRGVMRVAGPVVVLVGIGLVAYSAIDFANTVGTESSKLTIVSRRTLRSPEHGWVRWVGMTFIAAGVVGTSLGFELFSSRKPESQPDAAPRRKSIGQPLGRAARHDPQDDPSGRRNRAERKD
jgi:hypothetical protein